jgi:hypothetical protein
VARADLPSNEGALFLASLVFNTLVAVVVFIVFGGLALLKRRVSEESGNDQSSEAASGRESSTRADGDRDSPKDKEESRSGSRSRGP